MNASVRITLAGLGALALIVSHAAYRAWPGWRGTDLYLPAAIYPLDSAGAGYVRIDLASERLRLDVPCSVNEPSAELFQPVRGTGALLSSTSDAAAAVQMMRGRDLFVQLEPDQPMWPQGPVAMRPASVSDTRVTGATNLAGHITRVDNCGRLWLTFGSHQLTVPPDVAARATPLGMIREANRPPRVKHRPPDPGTFAIFRVLPSGRAVLAGLTVDGKRVD